MRIREAVQAIKPMMLEPQEIQVARPASATSAASLNLDATGTPATVHSTEEVNTTPTSYSIHGPEWTGSSTTQVTISGEYDGSNGTDTEKPLAEVERFSSVQSGSISVNGVSIDIDASTDSLNDVLDRITASGAEVNANFDSTSQTVSLNSENLSSELTLSSGATNFFSAVRISDGTYNAVDGSVEAQAVNVADVTDLIVESIVDENAEKPWEQDPVANTTPVAAANGSMLTTLVNNMAHAMNTLFDDSAFNESSGAFLEGIRNDIRSAVSTSLNSEGPQFNTDFGISFDFEKTDKGVFNFSQANQRQFETALTTPDGYASIPNTLFGTESNGLFNQLHASLTTAASDLESDVGATGLFLDVSI